MDSLPKLDTVAEPFSNSARNSYASATESDPRSARSSYASISDINSISSRSSYSPITDSLGRVSSFSRTSDSYVPDSLESTPISSRDSSPNSPTRWMSQEVDQTSSRLPSHQRPRSHSKTGSTDGPSALRQLQNVKNVICVAFGAFDRYYISWEDNDGEFHQESHKLPDSLYKWLFPPTGETRHLPTLQVSFGSNDDFFASDQDGKLSSRDASPQAEKKAPPPRLAEVARGFMRRKANTISSPKLPEDLQEKLEEKPMSPRLKRRSTFLEGQPSPRAADSKQSVLPLSLSLHTRRESRTEFPSREQTAMPLSLSLHARRESRSDMPKIEERKGPSAPEQYPLQLDAKAELAKAEQRRVMFTAADRQISPPEINADMPKTEQPQIRVAASEPQLTRLETKSDPEKGEQRRSYFAGLPPVRPSWPERKTLFMNRERIMTGVRDTPAPAPKSNYVDAVVQTDLTDADITAIANICDPTPMQTAVPAIPLPPRHSHVPIGSMLDFFRGQNSLGDALHFV
ncbi:uncharacterized protein PAC_13461 [Phialocephala subalpina]|uniref:Uncharacterized protein n=1 Tax=Phialocephala subalpina TaxID=576137 RepID=A0A1L7XEW5_9HELO|nr:uncharacterized protein PAC_13461 [Phialocephala subalpina]